MSSRIAGILLLLASSLLRPQAAEPADPDLIPEARQVLSYLESVYGKKTVAGVSGMKNAEAIYKESGRYPAIVAFDLSGWNSPTWGPTYTPVVESVIHAAKSWSEKGGIVSLQFHWKHPLKTNGTAWVGAHGKNPPSGTFDMAAAMQKGTPENKVLMEDLAKHADYLQKLADARVPVLWRPYHEIEGGWFWWTDTAHPEATAGVWRMTFDYLVRERKLHNLIWVYSAALRAAGKENGAEAVEFRKSFYPGKAYVDIAGIDIYPNKHFGWGKPEEDAYTRAWQIMAQVAPGKMLALCEGQAIPSPELMRKSEVVWLYALPWWGPGKANTPEWVRHTYQHEHVITLEELPWNRRK